MAEISLRNLVSTIGITVAMLTAILIPAGFLYDAYTDDMDKLAFKARLNANRIAEYIYTHEALWEYQQLRLVDQIRLPYDSGEAIHQKLYTIDGDLMLEDGPALSGPILTSRATIVVAGTPRGYLDVSGSFNGGLIRVGISALVGTMLGLAMYFALRTFPLRVLDRTIGALNESQHQLKIQNERLAISETQLSNALVMARAGNWEYDVANDRFTFNDNFYRIFHTTAEEVGGYTMSSTDYARRFVHPDDLGVVAAEVKEAIETTDPQFSREFEHRMLYADGTTGYIAVRFFVVKDEHGRTIATYGVNQDITARKRSEIALIEAKSRLDAALTNMSQGLCMFDADEKLVIANARFAEMFGLSADAIKPGMTNRELTALAYRGKRTDEEIDRTLALQRSLLEEGKEGSAIDRLSDGRSFSVTLRPTPEGGFVSTFEDITARKRAEEEMEYLAHHDALTALLNRAAFYERLGSALSHRPRSGSIAVFSLDLDRFKTVNDSLGHPIGDLLLQAAAERMRSCVRGEDIVARLGGDEFAIIQLPSEQPGITALAGRLIEEVGAPYDLDGHQIVVSVSIGIAIAPTDGNEPDVIVKNADLALYRAKADGGSVYRFFQIEMDARMQVRRTLELDLRKAIKTGEFELHYQPIINVATGQITCCEALVRWRHPQRGMLEPLDFIPIAEETGLIVPLGDWILLQACIDAASWPEQIFVAVNLSPAQFKSRNLVATVVDALTRSGLPASRLELEITEMVLLEESEGAFVILHQLRDLGIRIAMDDFGTGYSSLGYLRSFPFDKIKIDQSFIRDLPGKEDSLAIIRAVVGLSSSLGITTTAEGVETKEQLASLTSEGCDEFQGFYFSQPRPAADLAHMFDTNAAEKKPAT